MKKCLVIGAAMLDIVMKIDSLPKSGEDVYAESQEMTVGGCAYNVADIMKHFQVPHTLFAPLGKGVYADIISEKLKAAGHESVLRSDAEDNGYCLCMVEKDGERTFLTLPGIECKFEREWFDLVDAQAYESAYVSGYEIEGDGGDAIIEFFEKHPKITLYYAPGPRITFISEEKRKRLDALHPVLHLNEKEALESTGTSNYQEAAKVLFERTKNTVIITLGASGVYLEDGEGLLLPAEPTKAIDTIGAGDSHIGAVISMRMMGKSFAESLACANRVSALVVSVEGPTLTEEQFEKGDLK